MTDHVTINPMSGGELIAADDVDGVKVQRVKIGYGPDGVLTDVQEWAPLPTTLVSGATAGSDRATVTTPGTPVPLPSHPGILGVTIRALLDNQDLVYIGGPTPGTGFELAAGDAVSVDVTDPAAVYLDATTAGDGVCLLWIGVAT